MTWTRIPARSGTSTEGPVKICIKNPPCEPTSVLQPAGTGNEIPSD
jgi:hypothetical protein